MLMRHEPLLRRADGNADMDTWNRLQAEMDRRTSRKGVVQASTTAELTNIATCEPDGKCGGPMYRFRTDRKLADGSRRLHLYYRCHGDERNPSTCRNMVPLAEAHAHVHWQMANGERAQEKHVKITTIPGGGWEDEIANVEKDLRELVEFHLDAPDYDQRSAALRAKRSELKAREAKPPKVMREDTGMTSAEYWLSLQDDQARRKYLLECEAKLYCDSALPGCSSDHTECPKYRFVITGEWL